MRPIGNKHAHNETAFSPCRSKDRPPAYQKIVGRDHPQQLLSMIAGLEFHFPIFTKLDKSGYWMYPSQRTADRLGGDASAPRSLTIRLMSIRYWITEDGTTLSSFSNTAPEFARRRKRYPHPLLHSSLPCARPGKNRSLGDQRCLLWRKNERIRLNDEKAVETRRAERSQFEVEI